MCNWLTMRSCTAGAVYVGIVPGVVRWITHDAVTIRIVGELEPPGPWIAFESRVHWTDDEILVLGSIADVRKRPAQSSEFGCPNWQVGVLGTIVIDAVRDDID